MTTTANSVTTNSTTRTIIAEVAVSYRDVAELLKHCDSRPFCIGHANDSHLVRFRGAVDSPRIAIADILYSGAYQPYCDEVVVVKLVKAADVSDVAGENDRLEMEIALESVDDARARGVEGGRLDFIQHTEELCVQLLQCDSQDDPCCNFPYAVWSETYEIQYPPALKCEFDRAESVDGRLIEVYRQDVMRSCGHVGQVETRRLGRFESHNGLVERELAREAAKAVREAETSPCEVCAEELATAMA